MRDRRFYGRLKTDINALVYIGEGHREKNCRVVDICEAGICFELPAKDMAKDIDTIHEGDRMDFQFADFYMLMNMKKSAVMTGRCVVKHIEPLPGKVMIGCYIRNNEFQRYAENRKFAETARLFVRNDNVTDLFREYRRVS